MSHPSRFRAHGLLLVLAVATSCLKPISVDDAAAVISRSDVFARPRYARTPREMILTERYSYKETGAVPFSISQLASIDPAVAILKLSQYVDVKEATFGSGQGATHVLTLTPRPTLPAGELELDRPDEESATPDESDVEQWRFSQASYSNLQMKRTRGWRVPIATRAFVRVEAVHKPGDHNIAVAPNYVVIDFLYRWKPSEVGSSFDAQGEELPTFPDSVQEEARTKNVSLTTAKPLLARATLRRTPSGWTVTYVDWMALFNRR